MHTYHTHTHTYKYIYIHIVYVHTYTCNELGGQLPHAPALEHYMHTYNLILHAYINTLISPVHTLSGANAAKSTEHLLIFVHAPQTWMIMNR